MARACSAGHALQARWVCVRCVLWMRWVCARCSLDLSRRTYEYPACAPRVSGVGPARFAHVWRSSGEYIHASSSAHIFVHAQKSRRTPRTTTNAYRWSSALDVQVTHADAHPANDNALAKIAKFSVHGPCVVHV